MSVLDINLTLTLDVGFTLDFGHPTSQPKFNQISTSYDVVCLFCACWAAPSSAPTKRCKRCIEHPVLMTQVLQLWQLRRPFFVLFEEFSKPVEIGINTCLILQNTLDDTITALAVQNKREHPNQVKGFVETAVPNYCDPTFASHFRMKRQKIQMKDNPLLTSETVIIYMTLLFFCEY